MHTGKIFRLMVVLGATFPLSGQDKQSRLIFHPTIDINKGWFLTGWTIGNVKINGANNINLFAGIGYRKQDWWLEGMIQRQWSRAGNQVLLDFRFQKQKARWIIYIEPAPFLNKLAFYDFVILERHQFIGKLNVGGETENVHRRGKDSIGGGPRASYPIGTVGKMRFNLAIAYQFRANERDALRLYFIVNRRFSRH